MRWLKGVALLALAVLLTVALSTPLGPVPAILPLLNPGQGVWGVAADAVAQVPASPKLPGLLAPVQVSYSKGDVPHVLAKNDHDLFFMQGYLQATNRLFQMDAMRRQGEGKLSEIIGPSALKTDEEFLRYGLLVGAQRTLARMRSTAAGRATLKDLAAYTAGVNLRISHDEATNSLPLVFHLLGYRPTRWTALDTLVVQEDMQQDLSMSFTPLDYAVMVERLGPQLASQLFPSFAPTPQHPYDPGPYPAPAKEPAPLPPGTQPSTLATAAQSILAASNASHPLMAGMLQGMQMSNNWAVGGALTASGKPLLAGDPHLDLTLPSIWYEIQLEDPNYDVVGVSLPGAPGILIGHNRSLAWSLTDTQSESTFFYKETVSPSHPNMYFFDGSWRKETLRTYQIPVKGSAPVKFTVAWTNNGPIMTKNQQTVAMDWTGLYPSQDITALLGVDRAHDAAEFIAALQPYWENPPHNFAFADTKGEIGIIAPGFYPIFPKGVNPALPMNGSGGSEWIGRIPANAVPQVLNPPSHFVLSANQRPVSPSYPYYIGTAWNDFSGGYRANTIYNFLANKANQPFTIAKMAQLQSDNQDYLALQMAPLIARAGQQLGLSGPVGAAVAQMANWPGTMTQDSVQASIYYTFWDRYLRLTFGPWWKHYGVPSKTNPDLVIGPGFTPLDEDLQAWTLNSSASPFLKNPVTGRQRTTAELMRAALKGALQTLKKQYGKDPANWLWGTLHTRTFYSVSGVAALARGPYPSDGDFITPDAATPEPNSTHGPSWRMIADLGNLNRSVAIYPGGQSENPLSPHYADMLPYWLSYQYWPLVFERTPRAGATTVYQP